MSRLEKTFRSHVPSVTCQPTFIDFREPQVLDASLGIWASIESKDQSRVSASTTSIKTAVIFTFQFKCSRMGCKWAARDDSTEHLVLPWAKKKPKRQKEVVGDFFRGTVASFLRASESPIAIACCRLFTLLVPYSGLTFRWSVGGS
jgi:hypothetical protein